MNKLTQKRLKERCHYNPSTGELIWKRIEEKAGWASSWNSRNSGKIVGNITKCGYLQTRIDGEKYQVHRLVWLFVHGAHPHDQIDHVNGRRSDNRIENLRVAPQLVNAKNQARRSNNTSGVTGVSWSSKFQKWFAQIMVEGKTIPLGYYDSVADAAAARAAANIKYGFHPNHGREAA